MQHHILVLAVLAGAVVAAAVTFVLFWVARHRAVRPLSPARPEPASVVHVIASPSELRDAVQRAARFERDVARLVEQRAARYDLLAEGTTPSGLRAVLLSGGVVGEPASEAAHVADASCQPQTA